MFGSVSFFFFFLKTFDKIYKKIILEFLKTVIVLHISVNSHSKHSKRLKELVLCEFVVFGKSILESEYNYCNYCKLNTL